MKITAAILSAMEAPQPYRDSHPLTVTDLELDPPRPGELLIRIDAAGLCHSDLSVINGDRPRPLPMALGHEATGIVEALGSDEPGFAVGDRVVVSFLPQCGTCVNCLSGEAWLCANGAASNGAGRMLSGGCRLHDGGSDVHHHLGVSAFATHAVVDRCSAVKVPADMPPEIAALFGCAVLTGVGALLNTGNLRCGESVAIVGLGGVGLSAVLGAVAAGANPVIAIDPVAEKRALALDMGATHAVAPEDAAECVAANTPGGADLVLETVGRATVLEAAYALGRRGSRIVTVGLPHPDDKMALAPVSLVGEGKSLIGSYMGSAVPMRDIPRYIALWKAGRLPVEKLLTGTGPLSQINEMMDELASGRAVRQVVLPSDE